MEVLYNGLLSEEDKVKVKKLSDSCGILFDTARLLFCRNIDTEQKVKRFLNPSSDYFYNPFLLTGMNDAVKRLTQAKYRNENVLIFGDYDADGICATTVLFYALRDFGIRADFVVPEREDGYGVNIPIIEKLNAQKKIDLIITVDCGISDYEKINEIKSRGIDVIVTDHHEPPEIIPDAITINPKIKGQKYPFSGLCGAGVAYKLSRALIGEKADEYLDFTALATVADSMELVDENRDIVSEGLKLFNDRRIRKCFKALLNENVTAVNAQTLSFVLAPRVNAGGRMGDALTPLKLFTTTSSEVIYALADKLNGYNALRQTLCDEIHREAREKILKTDVIKDKIIVVGGEGWKTGFIGIVASRLAEEFCRPVIVFAGLGDVYKGSARSVDGVNIFNVLSEFKNLFVSFGGHSQAAGVTVSADNFEVLRKSLNRYADEHMIMCADKGKIVAEWNVDGTIDQRFAEETELLEPFGVGNRRPVFTVTENVVLSKPLKAGSPHYSFNTRAIPMLEFNGEKDVEILGCPVKKKLLFEINVSLFKGRKYIKGYLKKIVPEYGDFSSVKGRIFERQLENFIADKDVSAPVNSDYEIDGTGYGSIYALSDYRNIGLFPKLQDLPISAFVPDAKDCSDCVVIAPQTVPEGYDKIVYLDTPLSYLKTSAKSFSCERADGRKIFAELNDARSEFTDVFVFLKSSVGKEFSGASSFYERHKPDCEEAQFVFATEVFFELGFFFVKDGILRFNPAVKNALTNSVLYSKISCIKAEL